MPQSHDSTRRDFVKTSAFAAGALSLPRFAIGQAGGSPNGTMPNSIASVAWPLWVSIALSLFTVAC